MRIPARSGWRRTLGVQSGGDARYRCTRELRAGTHRFLNSSFQFWASAIAQTAIGVFSHLGTVQGERYPKQEFLY